MRKALDFMGKIVGTIIVVPCTILVGAFLGSAHVTAIVLDSLWERPYQDQDK